MAKPKHRQMPISRAELARRKGVTAGAVTRAAQTFLRAACIGRRMDLAHPDVVQWLAASAVASPEATSLLLEESTVSLSELAAMSRIDVAQLTRDLPRFEASLVPIGHVSVAEFAARAGTDSDEVIAATAADLAPAVTASGRLDMAHSAALSFMAARPFKRDAKRDPIVPDVHGEGFLAPACVGKRIDADHPVCRVFLARCLGRIPDEVA